MTVVTDIIIFFKLTVIAQNQNVDCCGVAVNIFNSYSEVIDSIPNNNYSSEFTVIVIRKVMYGHF